MLELGFYENIVKDPKLAKNMTVKIIATALCSALALAMTVAISIKGYPPALLILGLGFIAAILYVVYMSFSVEYECSVSETEISVSKIYAKKRRKQIFSAESDEILLIAPATEDNLKKAQGYRPRAQFDIYDKASKDSLWLIVFEIEKGEMALLLFTAPSGIEKILRKLRPSAICFR